MLSIFLTHLHGPGRWLTIALTGFAILFFGVGIFRVVEFNGVGLRKNVRGALIVLHLFGCLFFSAAMVVLGIDGDRRLNSLMTSLLVSGVLLLFPIHIFLALKRRLKQGDFSTREVKN
jgi:hypothetical protein